MVCLASATQRTHFHRRTRRSLFNNNISGTIPNCIGSLVHLQNLFLGNMQLTGARALACSLQTTCGCFAHAKRRHGAAIAGQPHGNAANRPPSQPSQWNAAIIAGEHAQRHPLVRMGLGCARQCLLLTRLPRARWMYGNRLDGAVPPSLCRLSKLLACDLHAQSVAFAPCHFGSCSVLTSTCRVPACGNFLLACAPSNNATVCGALSDLYVATAGWAWSASAGWAASASNVTTDYCSFQGVTCVGGLVTQISLAGNNLNGTLPASLANVSTLRKLCVHMQRLLLIACAAHAHARSRLPTQVV